MQRIYTHPTHINTYIHSHQLSQIHTYVSFPARSLVARAHHRRRHGSRSNRRRGPCAARVLSSVASQALNRLCGEMLRVSMVQVPLLCGCSNVLVIKKVCFLL